MIWHLRFGHETVLGDLSQEGHRQRVEDHWRLRVTTKNCWEMTGNTYILVTKQMKIIPQLK